MTFKSPVQEFLENRLDLNDLLVKRPSATFFTKVDGQGLAERGMRCGDLLVIDRSLEPRINNIVVAEQDGRLVVKNFQMDQFVWGVVTYGIRRYR